MQILCLNFGSASLKFAVFSVHGEVRMEGTWGAPRAWRRRCRRCGNRWRPPMPGSTPSGSVWCTPATGTRNRRATPARSIARSRGCFRWRRSTTWWRSVPCGARRGSGPECRRSPSSIPRSTVPCRRRPPATRFRRRGGKPACGATGSTGFRTIDRGRSVDTLMGLTPLEGLVMGTRCGDLDPGVAGYVECTLHLPLSDIETALCQESGMQALSGVASDVRRIEAAAAVGDEGANLAMHVYGYRVRKYIGAYAAAMGGSDALAFTGAVGENSSKVRALVSHGTEFLGFRLDPVRNSGPEFAADGVAALHGNDSALPVFVVRAREEWMIAGEARRLLVDIS